MRLQLCLIVIIKMCCYIGAERRPIYIIGHMVNSIPQVRRYLDLGSNAIESDIQFFPNGSVKEVYHGFPCDCFRTCTRSVKLPDYLRYLNKLTDPKRHGNYADKMVMQFFDLKTGNIRDKRNAGRDVARHILDYMWSDHSEGRQRVRALVYVETAQDGDIIDGFVEEFKERGKEDWLKDVGFDGGTSDLDAIRRMFQRLPESLNVWQGDGKSNCISAVYPDGRLRRAIRMRDSRNNHISKVYHWTIDLKIRMRLSLNLGVDGMITNDPDDLYEVLQESYYRNEFRLATPEDDPFARFG